MDKKILWFSLLALVVLAIGVSSVSARGWLDREGDIDPEKVVERQSQMFEQQADLLGISIDQLKEYWAQGKNIMEIAEELGFSQEDLQEKRQAECQARLEQELQNLVENGTITQEQADARLEAMQNREIGEGGFQNQHKTGIAGEVSDISGTTITLSSKQGFGEEATDITYAIDASNATVEKISQDSDGKPSKTTISVSDIQIGDIIMVRGEVDDTSVVAKKIVSGQPNKGFLHGSRPGGKFGPMKSGFMGF